VHQFEEKFSSRAKLMKASEVREILKLTQKPDVISFAGGLPNPLSFPVEIINEIVCDLLKGGYEKVLQYGTTEGIDPLREEIAKMAREDGMNINFDDILITHGSQQALDFVGRNFIDPNDCVVLGAPTYLGAKNVWMQNKAQMHEVTVDDDGQNIDMAEETIRTCKSRGQNVKILYIMPTFQNPSGVTLSEKRRKQVIDIANELDVLVVEDDPYGKIRFEGEPLKPLKAYDDEGRVIYTSTFSKLLAPGFRIAWVTASPTILQKFILNKQTADLHTNTFGQWVTYEYMHRGHLKKHIPNIIKLYKEKCELLLKAMDAHFPEDVHYTRPKGGMFSWASLPETVDTKEMLPTAIDRKVAYVVGSAFYADPRKGKSKMRLNFTHPANDKIEVGVKALAGVMEEFIAKGRAKAKNNNKKKR
jgi:2-aminoadipate transaminase